MDVVAMFEPVTKWAADVHASTPTTFPRSSARRCELARTEKPGAVHIELPEDIAKLEASGTAPFAVRKRFTPPRCRTTRSSTPRLRGCAQEREAAQLILAGNGCIRQTRQQTVAALFCEKTGIGVVSTFMAKGCGRHGR